MASEGGCLAPISFHQRKTPRVSGRSGTGAKHGAKRTHAARDLRRRGRPNPQAANTGSPLILAIMVRAIFPLSASSRFTGWPFTEPVAPLTQAVA